MSFDDTNQLNYLFDSPPEPSVLKKVVEGIYWIRMPMPFSLDHINLWLLEEAEQWTIIDTGLATDTIIELWEKIFSEHLKGKPIKRVICTHMHPDHVGLAGWLCQRDNATLYMSHGEYTQCRVLLSDKGREAPEEALDFYRSAGFSDSQLLHYKAHFGWFGKLVSALPVKFYRLRDDDILTIGAYEWQIIVGCGHSPEHVCLYNAALNLLISGDQILPTISSNISVWPMEPFANPMKDWLVSCERLKQAFNDDVIVLPAHGLPFQGASMRLQALIDEHTNDLDKLVANCKQPQRVIDVFSILFKARIDNSNLIMATGESFAHFNCLVADNRLTQTVDKDGVNWFSQPNP